MTAFPTAAQLAGSSILESQFQDAISDFVDAAGELLGGKAAPTLVISSNSIVPTTGIVLVDGALSSNDLNTIVPLGISTWDGRLLMLRIIDAAHAVVLKHLAGGTGQISTKSGRDLVLDKTNKWVWLRYNHTAGYWEEVLSDDYRRMPYVAKTAAFTVYNSDRGRVFYCTGTFTITFDAAANLGDDFYCYVVNEGSGTITLDGNAAETIDGAATVTVEAAISCTVIGTGTALKTFAKTLQAASQAETDALTILTKYLTPGVLATHTAKGKHMLPLEATRFQPTTTSPTHTKNVAATNQETFISLDFGDTSTESAWAKVAMPPSWNFGSLQYEVVWSPVAGTAGQGVRWVVQSMCRGDGDAIDIAPSTGVALVDTHLNAGQHTTPLSAADTPAGTPAQNDSLWIKVSRTPADASDTLVGDARLLELRVYGTFTKGNDA